MPTYDIEMDLSLMQKSTTLQTKVPSMQGVFNVKPG